MRALDPLIEACRHMEAAAARAPGFGDALADWLTPLYADRPASERRLMRAACLLHDVNWRAHPDYRAELCFESVTRANVAGIDHAGRVFLGFALMHRYKSGGASSEETTRYGGLLSEERIGEAVTLGRAMRLGAMLSGSAVGVLQDVDLALVDGALRLTLRGPAREFAGETVERRLQSLAAKLGAVPDLAMED